MSDTAVPLAEVEAQETVLGEFCAALDPDAIPLYDVAAAYRSLCRMKNLVSGAATRLARRVEESGAWADAGYASPADYLAEQSGTSKTAANESLSASKRLKNLPGTEDAVRNGELSDQQTSAIADAATANPAAEDDLLEASKNEGLTKLRNRCQRTKAEADPDRETTYQRIRKNRYLRRHTDGEGAYNLSMRTTPDAGAQLDAALQPLIDRIFGDARQSGQYEAVEAYAADALIELARNTTSGAPNKGRDRDDAASTPHASHNVDGDVSDDETTGDDAGAGNEAATDNGHLTGIENTPAGPACRRCATNSGTGSRSTRPESKVIALIDYDALRRGHTLNGETCEIAGVGPVPVSTVREMLSDAFLAMVVTDGVDVYNVAHPGRQVTAHQRTALETRGYWCEVPDCSVRHNLEIDHITGWAVTKHTKLDDLAWLCRHHHYQKTHLGHRLHGPPGHRQWIPPADANSATGPPNSPPSEEPTVDAMSTDPPCHTDEPVDRHGSTTEAGFAPPGSAAPSSPPHTTTPENDAPTLFDPPNAA